MQKVNFNQNSLNPAFGANTRAMMKIMREHGLVFKITSQEADRFCASIIPAKVRTTKGFDPKKCIPVIGLLGTNPSEMGKTISEAKLNLLRKLPDKGLISIGYGLKSEEGHLFRQFVETEKISYNTLA